MLSKYKDKRYKNTLLIKIVILDLDWVMANPNKKLLTYYVVKADVTCNLNGLVMFFDSID